MFCARLIRSLSMVTAVLLAASAMTVAQAATPTGASGTFADTSCTLTNPQPVGNNTIFDITCDSTWTGTFSGTSVGTGTLMVNNANGTARSDAIQTFTGMVNGTPGTVTLTERAESNPIGGIRATDVILSGTGDLAGLQGVLHFAGTVPPCCLPAETYTGQIQFGAP